MSDFDRVVREKLAVERELAAVKRELEALKAKHDLCPPPRFDGFTLVTDLGDK